MNIAFLTTDNRQADGRYSLTTPYFGTAPAALLEGLAAHSEAEIHVIACTQSPMTSPHQLAKNIHFHSLVVPRWGWLRTGYVGCIQAVRKKLREIQPDLVHSQGTERDCAVSGVFFRGPKLLTIHGNCRAIAQLPGSKFLSYWWLQARLERFCLPRFDGVICISRYTQSWVSGLARKTWLLPNAVDSRFFEIRSRKVGPLPVILVVAHVDARKNQIGLIRSLDSLANQRPLEVRFFGRCAHDPYGEKFRELIGTRPWCVWGGMVDREKLRGEFSQASVVMLPTWEDNCPMVVLEAQAAGIPVIASNVGGVPDLIEDGFTGILTDPTRPETMPQALKTLLDQPDYAKRLAEQGRKQAAARFHPRVIAEQHLRIYREVIAHR
jgi:glycosyltransferase involved in cell wall biosynthesis